MNIKCGDEYANTERGVAVGALILFGDKAARYQCWDNIKDVALISGPSF